MSPFHTQLTAARKAKHLTQEQLSECMNVSRPTVSRWENGHILPDIDTVRRLSILLEFDFIAGHALADAAPDPESPVPDAPATVPEEPALAETAPTQTPPAPAKPSFRRYLPYAFLIAAALFLFLWLCYKHTAPVQSMQETYYSLDWYRRTQEDTDPMQPYLQITSPQNPLKAGIHEPLNNKVGWLYEFHLTEINGIPLTVSSVTISYFHQDGTFRTNELDEETIRHSFMNSLDILPGLTYHITGGFPLQDMLGVGIRVEVKDSEDQALTFRYYLELSQEIAS